MELLAWALLVVGLATTGLRLSWSDRTWPAAVAVVAWSGLPWLTNECAASTNAAMAFAWATAPERAGTIAAILIAEAIAGGWIALNLVGTLSEKRRPTAGQTLAAIIPSPALFAGLVGSQVSLFHRVSGQGFEILNLGLSACIVVGLTSLTLTARSIWARPGRRAEVAIPIYACLLLVGVALPPLLHPPITSSRGVAGDVRAFAAVAGFVGVVSGCGLAVRLLRP